MEKNKLLVQRFSGRPVRLADLEAYDIEFKQNFDRIQAEVGLDMLAMHKQLREVDAVLLAKYGNKELIELPNSQEDWHMLITAYEAPFMIAKSSDDPTQLVLVLMDQPIS